MRIDLIDRREAEQIYESGKEAVVEALLAMSARLKVFEQKFAELEQKIASLTANSTNSSKSPSSDGPQVQRPVKKNTGRSPGGQKGHKGHKRALLPVEQMDHVYDHYPKTCAKCSAALDAKTCPETSDPLRTQIFELPHIQPIRTERRYHELRC